MCRAAQHERFMPSPIKSPSTIIFATFFLCLKNSIELCFRLLPFQASSMKSRFGLAEQFGLAAGWVDHHHVVSLRSSRPVRTYCKLYNILFIYRSLEEVEYIIVSVVKYSARWRWRSWTLTNPTEPTLLAWRTARSLKRQRALCYTKLRRTPQLGISTRKNICYYCDKIYHY